MPAIGLAVETGKPYRPEEDYALAVDRGVDDRGNTFAHESGRHLPGHDVDFPLILQVNKGEISAIGRIRVHPHKVLRERLAHRDGGQQLLDAARLSERLIQAELAE